MAYACLSYCWGQENQNSVTTTKANLNSHKQRIELRTLPQTIQDAVQITRQLQISYLWIDALCIVQDDAFDWLKEATLMGSIYQNAVLTIAAVSSPHAESGMLRSRNTEQEEDSKEAHMSVLCRQYLTLPIPTSAIHQRQGPLFSRAWALQEECLSPRILYWSKKCISWYCMTCSSVETGTARDNFNMKAQMPTTYGLLDDLEPPIGQRSRLFETTGWFARLRAVCINGNELALGSLSEDANVIRELWRTLVNEYTRRRLTVATDYLPALMGLAARFQELTNDDYAAGLWKSCLVEDLEWFFESTGETRSEGSSTYSAPSWSWASAAAARTEPMGVSYYSRWDYNSSSRSIAPVLKILDIECCTMDRATSTDDWSVVVFAYRGT